MAEVKNKEDKFSPGDYTNAVEGGSLEEMELRSSTLSVWGHKNAVGMHLYGVRDGRDVAGFLKTRVR